jgi:hypothetical protein
MSPEVVMTAVVCIDALKGNEWDIMCLDHDLGGETYVDSDNKNTGMEVVRWIVANKPKIGQIFVHSYNVGAAHVMAQDLSKAGYAVVRAPFGHPLFDEINRKAAQ